MASQSQLDAGEATDTSTSTGTTLPVVQVVPSRTPPPTSSPTAQSNAVAITKLGEELRASLDANQRAMEVMTATLQQALQGSTGTPPRPYSDLHGRGSTSSLSSPLVGGGAYGAVGHGGGGDVSADVSSLSAALERSTASSALLAEQAEQAATRAAQAAKKKEARELEDRVRKSAFSPVVYTTPDSQVDAILHAVFHELTPAQRETLGWARILDLCLHMQSSASAVPAHVRDFFKQLRTLANRAPATLNKIDFFKALSQAWYAQFPAHRKLREDPGAVAHLFLLAPLNPPTHSVHAFAEAIHHRMWRCCHPSLSLNALADPTVRQERRAEVLGVKELCSLLFDRDYGLTVVGKFLTQRFLQSDFTKEITTVEDLTALVHLWQSQHPVTAKGAKVHAIASGALQEEEEREGEALKLRAFVEATVGDTVTQVLVDTAADHSFLAATWVQSLGLQTQPAEPICVEGYAGGHLVCDTQIKDLVVVVGGTRLCVKGYVVSAPDDSCPDVLLGMDILQHHAMTFTPATTEVGMTLAVDRGEAVELMGMRSNATAVAASLEMNHSHCCSVSVCTCGVSTKVERRDGKPSGDDVKRPEGRGADEFAYLQVTYGDAHTSPAARKAAMALGKEFRDIFGGTLGEGAPRTPTKMNIEPIELRVGDLETSRNNRAPQRRFSPVADADIQRQQDAWMEEGIIEHSNSPNGAQYVYVPYPDKPGRVCGDYRAVNNSMVFDAYPAKDKETYVQRIARARLSSSTDLWQSYFQLPLAEKSRYLTAVRHNGMLVQFTVLPYGVLTACASLQRTIDGLTEGLEASEGFMDDISAAHGLKEATKDVPRLTGCSLLECQALADLRALFVRCREWGATLKAKKTFLLQTTVSVLGATVSFGCIRPLVKRMQGLIDFPSPSNSAEARRFCNIVSYDHHSIPGLAAQLEPIQRVCGKKGRFDWTEEQERAFVTLKTAVVTLAMQQPFVHGAETVLATDFSNVGVSAAIFQRDWADPSRWKLIHCVSRKTLPAETRYDASPNDSPQGELVALRFGLDKMEYWLINTPFTWMCDFKPHESLLTRDTIKNARLQRTFHDVRRFPMIAIEHHPRTSAMAGVLDALARGVLPVTEGQTYHLAQVAAVSSGWASLTDATLVARLQAADPSMDHWAAEAVAPTGAQFYVPYKHSFLAAMVDRTKGVLSLRLQAPPVGMQPMLLLVPLGLRKVVMQQAHGAAHAQYLNMIDELQAHCFWATMETDVRAFVADCVTCQQMRVHNAPKSLQSTAPEVRRFARVHLDLQHLHLERDRGTSYLLTARDVATGVLLTAQVPSKHASVLRRAIETLVLLQWGNVEVMAFDKGTEFDNKVVRDFLESQGVLPFPTLPHVPDAQGTIERPHRQLGDMVAKMHLDEGDAFDLELAIARATFAFNCQVNRSRGVAPFTALYSQRPATLLSRGTAKVLPAQQVEEVRNTMRAELPVDKEAAENRALASAKANAQRETSARPRVIQPGEHILIRNFARSKAVNKRARWLLRKDGKAFKAESVSYNGKRVKVRKGKHWRWVASKHVVPARGNLVPLPGEEDVASHEAEGRRVPVSDLSKSQKHRRRRKARRERVKREQEGAKRGPPAESEEPAAKRSKLSVVESEEGAQRPMERPAKRRKLSAVEEEVAEGLGERVEVERPFIGPLPDVTPLSEDAHRRRHGLVIGGARERKPNPKYFK